MTARADEQDPLDAIPDYREGGFSKAEGEDMLRLPLEVVTPIYGGGVRPRRPDDLEPVRVASIRGALRIWWRALEAPRYATPTGLYDAERLLWGGLAREHGGVTRSPVVLAVDEVVSTALDETDIALGQDDAYALWPARAMKVRGEPPAPRRRPGVRFTLSVTYPAAFDDAVRRTLRAWLLFGGIGGRTRRGCGAVAITDETLRSKWLPADLSAASLAKHLAPKGGPDRHVSTLSGARLAYGAPQASATTAWHASIKWLRDFRQGAATTRDVADRGGHARMRPSTQQGPQGRPGRSRWPEPDKIRQHFGKRSFDHEPLPGHGREMAWPRAAFGLPMEVRFQSKQRDGSYYPLRPPPDVALAWTHTKGKDGVWELIDRLASPLVIRPVQLADGRFVPVALWMSRALPAGAKAGLYNRGGFLEERSLADINRVIAPDDTANFTPLAGKSSVREAFMDHLLTLAGLRGVTL